MIADNPVRSGHPWDGNISIKVKAETSYYSSNHLALIFI